MLKVLKKIGLIKKDDVAEKPNNGDVTSKSFGGMGREKLRKDILKHKGMGKAPIPTAAGLALKQKQEVDKATARIYDDNKVNNNTTSIYGADSYGYIGNIGIISSSLDKSSTSVSMPITPTMQLSEEKIDLESFNHIFESKKDDIKDNINLPSLSDEASMTFSNENNIDNIEVPSDLEIDSIQNNQNLEFPGYSNITLKNNHPSNHTLIEKNTDELSLNQKDTIDYTSDTDTIDFISSSTSEIFTIEKDKNKESFNKLSILDNNYEKVPLSTLSLEDDDSEFNDIPSLTLEITPIIPSQNKISENFFSTRTVAETIHTTHNEDLHGKDLDFAQELATIYSEGNLDYVITELRNHLNNNKGNVPQRFWYMLMDCYQVEQNEIEFEKVAIAFAYLFNTSPPSWFVSDDGTKKNVMSGKNIMILEPNFKLSQTEKFKPFLLAAKEEKFCRINVSPCKFELSEYIAIEKLYELFKNLRKSKVFSVLMGDNNLINFCKTYMNPVLTNKTLKKDFLENEKTFWLLYLEILQWKGIEQEFDEVALDFAMKFEISPPGWEQSDVMSLDKVSKINEIVNENNLLIIEKYLTSNNIDNLLEIINKGFQTSNKAEIDLSSVDTIDFAAAGSISYHIQELWSNTNYSHKKVIFRYPNEMILTLLEMVGVTEFVEIITRKR